MKEGEEERKLRSERYLCGVLRMARDADGKLLRERPDFVKRRDKKLKELKKLICERDASGSKQVLRTFLKEKSDKKISKAKTPKRSSKKRAEHE